MKLNGKVHPTSFSYQDTSIHFSNWEKWYLDSISLEHLQALFLWHSSGGQESETVYYMAPATNKEEAQHVLKKLGY